MMMIIKNGVVVTPSDEFKADILVENGKISALADHINRDGAEIVDAEGKYVIPGAIDAHTHMDLDVGFSRAVDDFYTGTIAAACGGTTTIIDHLAFGPKGCSLKHQIEEYHRLADNKAVIDYSFHGVVQHVNDDILNEMKELCEEGIQSFKGYLTYDYKLDDEDILRMLKKIKTLGGIAAFHAENHYIVTYLRNKFIKEGKTAPIYHAKSRPSEAEAEAIQRLVVLAHLAGDAPLYIVHVSTKEGLERIKEARDRGQKNIYVETCPQYLVLDEERYLDEDGLKYVMSPPLRTKDDNEALWDGIKSGQVDVIATDHCPFNFKKEKQLGKDDFTKCPNGAPGVEERVKIMISEGVQKRNIPLTKMVQLLSTNPAKIYGLYPQKGTIAIGSDGDFVILDLNNSEILTKKNMRSAVDYTTYEGMKIDCSIDAVIQRGKVIVRNNEFLGHKGDGRFLKRKCN